MSTTASSAQRPARDGVTPRGSYPYPHRTYNHLTSVRHHWSRYATAGTVIGVMTKPGNLTRTTELTAPASTFEMCFTSTPRGARLARRLTAVRLDAWGIPYGTPAHDDLVLIVAELTGNAVRHGTVPGRDFRLRLHTTADGRTVRVEVTDARGERPPRHPCAAKATEADDDDESGRGLLLVAALAARWDWYPRPDGPGKTVWAEYTLAASPAVLNRLTCGA